MTHHFSAILVAQEYFTHIDKLHGLLDYIVFDQDMIFVSNFWQELFRRLETKLWMSTTYHPQCDTQIKVLNRSLEAYIRCMTGERPINWSL